MPIVARAGKICFEANAGIVVRQYQVEPSRRLFVLKSEKGARVTSAEFDSGEFGLKIDGKTAGKVSACQGRGTFDLQAGEHTVELAG